MKRTVIAAALVLLSSLSALAQYPVRIHSHNDYAQQAPFWLAYAVKANTVECDMFHVRGPKFLIGHSREDFSYNQNFDVWYLEPIVRMIRYNGGHAWNDDDNRGLQLMIDIKSEDPDEFMKALVKKLRKYPDVFDRSVNPHACLVIITGNKPRPENFDKYGFVRYDTSLSEEFTPAQLEKVELFSEYFGNYSKWDGKSELPSEDEKKIRDAIDKAHSLGKDIRFWEAPDTPAAWDKLIELGVDYLNTDKLVPCTEHLKTL